MCEIYLMCLPPLGSTAAAAVGTSASPCASFVSPDAVQAADAAPLLRRQRMLAVVVREMEQLGWLDALAGDSSFAIELELYQVGRVGGKDCRALLWGCAVFLGGGGLRTAELSCLETVLSVPTLQGIH